MEEVIAGARLVTWALAGADLHRAAQRLREAPGIRTVAPFGATLHVSADSEEALRRAVEALGQPGLRAEPIEPRLEDVFIALMQGAQDNYGASSAAREAA